MPTHPSAQGFERSTQAYDRGRPEYPAEASNLLLDRIGVGPSSRVLELGSGTGKFTRLVSARTAHLVATDPSAAMRRALGEKLPHLNCVAARAEDIPAAGASFDAVVCAQAFHWFGNAEAVREIRRVLVPGGYLGLIWNVRDEDTGWVRGLTEIMDPFSGDTPRYRNGEWKVPLAEEPGFTPLESATFRHSVRCDRATVVDRVASVSFIAVLDPKRHGQVRRDVQALIDAHPETRGLDVLDFPYRTDLYWCRKR